MGVAGYGLAGSSISSFGVIIAITTISVFLFIIAVVGIVAAIKHHQVMLFFVCANCEFSSLNYSIKGKRFYADEHHSLAIDWLIDWLAGWLIDRLIDWLIAWENVSVFIPVHGNSLRPLHPAIQRSVRMSRRRGRTNSYANVARLSFGQQRDKRASARALGLLRLWPALTR